jgi:hydrogenase-4 transcriptional activator
LVQVFLGHSDKGQFWLDFVPRHEPDSIITSLTFQRFIKQILAIENPPLESEAHDVLWPATDAGSCEIDDAIFESQPMRQILRTISKIAATNLSVMITGETGTGKEVVAKAIHEHSGRASKPFVALNCAAVPRDLLESQLFGYRRGAFSGATEQFQGIIRSANTGTLLLDEIGEMPLEMQPKLLRFLESGEIHGLGESRPTKVDVRLLFATNADLEEAVSQKRFREDLFFRMNVFPIRIPPLRERREEIPLLVSLFSHRFSREMSKEAVRFATDTMERLVLYSWPGNVRQLGNEVRRLTAIVDGGTVIPVELLAANISRSFHQKGNFNDSDTVTIRTNQSLREAVDALERAMIDSAMKRAGGRAVSAARILGLSRKGLYLKRERLGILGLSQHLPSTQKVSTQD